MLEIPGGVLHERGDFTVEFSLRATTALQSRTVVSAANTVNFNEFIILFSGDNKIVVYVHYGSYEFVLDESLVDGQWHDFAVVRELHTSDPDWLRLYVDGQLADETSVSTFEPLNVAPNGLLIGQEQDSLRGGFNPVQALKSDLDELRFWNVARTPEEIAACAGVAVDARDPDLIAYYRMDEAVGTTARDSSPNGFDATLGTADLGLAAPQRVQKSRPAPSVAGVGDATGDGRDDFAVIDDDFAVTHAVRARDQVFVVPGFVSETDGNAGPLVEIPGVITLDAGFDLEGMAVRAAGHFAGARGLVGSTTDFLVTAESAETLHTR